MMYKRILTTTYKNQTMQQVEENILALFNSLAASNFPVLGFIYEPYCGLWMISGANEIDALHEQMPFAACQVFDFNKYVSNLKETDIFWMVDLADSKVSLKRWYKNRSEF